MKQLHLFNGEATSKQRNSKLSRVRHRIKKEFLLIQRNNDAAGPRTVKQLMRAPKLLKDAMPRVIPADPKTQTLPWQYWHQVYMAEKNIQPEPVTYFESYEARTYEDISKLADILSSQLAGSEKLPTLDIQPTAKGIDAAFGRERAKELEERKRRKRGRTLFAKKPNFTPDAEAARELATANDSLFDKLFEKRKFEKVIKD